MSGRLSRVVFPTSPAICAFATPALPCVSAISISSRRRSTVSTVSAVARVSASTSARTRARCRRQNANATYPPIDKPTITARSTCSVSSTPATSSA